MRPTALILGAGRKRVGYYVALHLAKKGYRLFLHYRGDHPERKEIDAELRKLGAEPNWLQADLSNEDQVTHMFGELDGQTDHLDAMIHTAAIWKPVPWRQTKASDIEEHFRANTLGVILPALESGKRMTNQKSGGVITLVGDWAITRPYKNYLAYFASKGSIPTMTRVLAVELGSENPNVRVNCVEPGPVMLPEDMPIQEKEEAIQATLVQREGSPENVAQAVWSLMENSFVTGVCLPVDGGRSIWARGI